MQSAFGVDHGEISKGVGAVAGDVASASRNLTRTGGVKNAWNRMSTADKAITVGGSTTAGVGVAAYNKKKTGRYSGNGGVVGAVSRKMGSQRWAKPTNGR